MKKILKIFCLLLFVYAVYFPLTYFGSIDDKKELRVSHILVDSEEQANQIERELTQNNDFNKLAKKYKGGDIGYVQRDRLNKKLNSVVFKMDKNEVSKPVKTNDGWNIVKVNDIKYFSDMENFKYKEYRYLINI